MEEVQISEVDAKLAPEVLKFCMLIDIQRMNNF
jgi:hypothetical protein